MGSSEGEFQQNIVLSV